ncbi:hypothetical protein GCM10008904_09020 [Paraclostridium ghonii]|uniref:HTH LytTR-type domain-containing protein n=1 Tax=Paraclostridium ghonii TaxID=29358 RepID=A0ABU0N206_9FIRM|nr:LytTR family transcriptional regulator DNA-binding domain-containing protein [Paeniclostridium ghonii]MDQ0557189.1 hypothetical protein [Paeniclostridium ghonii]
MIEIIFTTSFIEYIKENYDYYKNNNFYRYKKSFLENTNYVGNIKQYVDILENKEEILASRSRFNEFKSKIVSSLGEKLC